MLAGDDCSELGAGNSGHLAGRLPERRSGQDTDQQSSSVIIQAVIHIFNREELEERFGGWPSFHDSEVQAVRLDSGQRADGGPTVEMDIHLFDVDGVLPNGHLNFVRHTLATLRFEGAEAIELEGFGPQNVLDDLVFEDLGSGAPGAARMLVSLPSNNGVGGSFRCENAIVISASDFEPGPRSVYHRR